MITPSGPGRHALGGLLGRYSEILHHAWRQRRHTDTPVRLAHELAFLPANLELTETPPHPAPLWAARTLLVVVLAVAVMATFGKLDIVAVAPGQLVPTANIKVIQPAVTGVVRQIRVQNGQRIVAAEVLLDLDPTQASADADQARTRRTDAQLALARARALLVAQEKDREPEVAPVAGATAARQADTQSLAIGAFREYRRNISALTAELSRRAAELDATHEEIAKLQQTVPLARQQADDYKELAQGKFVASHDYLDKEKLAIEQTHELAAQQNHARELAAGIEQQRLTVESTIATFRRQQWELLNQSDQQLAQTQDEETKAEVRQGFMQLRSPVDGVVQQLTVHTVGAVVTSAQPLMEIVPDDVLEVEARIGNKDIGFVNPGQTAVIKIATFPYARFGYLTGTVVKVSNDATTDKRLGLVFVARIRIPSNRFKVQDKWINLSPGMEVTAEIKTGTQKVWQYFLSPLIETGQSSLRER